MIPGLYREERGQAGGELFKEAENVKIFKAESRYKEFASVLGSSLTLSDLKYSEIEDVECCPLNTFSWASMRAPHIRLKEEEACPFRTVILNV